MMIFQSLIGQHYVFCLFENWKPLQRWKELLGVDSGIQDLQRK